MTPRLRAELEGAIGKFWKYKVDERILERWMGVPMRRYSVLEGLTVRWLEVSQA